VGIFTQDPTFSDCSSSSPHCAAAWGLRIINSNNIQIAGAGLYNWFQAYVQPCVDTQDCQQRVVQLSGNSGIWLYNLYTIGTVEMLNSDIYGTVLAKDNTNMPDHPFTSVVMSYLMSSADSATA
jgi:glucan 1,3-beta-glucosidase